MQEKEVGEVQIVPMKPAHIAALAALERQCFSAPWSEKLLERELSNPQAVFLVAEAGGEPMGYGGMYRVLGEGYVTNVAVFPPFRRKGVGQKLVGALYRQTENYLTLEVRVSNTPAIALYRGLGFKEKGRRRNFYENPTEDALIMTKTKEE